MSKFLKVIVLGITALLLAATAYAQEAATETAKPAQVKAAPSKELVKGLDEQVQEIKADVLGIAAELNRLEEKLLYPSDTQLALFVSLPEGEKFRLDAVEIELDGKQVTRHLYTYKELEALKKGGVQRIWVGNVKTGEHALKVTVNGKSEGGSELSQSEQFKIEKGIGPKLQGVVVAGGKNITLKDW